jgi:serine protease Do
VKKMALLVAVMLASSSAFGQQLTKDEKRALELKPGVVLMVLVVRGSVSFNVCPTPIPIGHSVYGTGFVYRPDGYIITNGHVVEHANQKDPHAIEVWQQSLRDDLIYKLTKTPEGLTTLENCLQRRLTEDLRNAAIEFVVGKGLRINASTPALKVVLANGKAYDGDILQYSPPITEGKGKDVAVVKIPASDLPTVALGNSDTVRVQDPVLVIGYPATASASLGDNQFLSTESDLVPSATNGHISAIKATANGSPVLQTDVAITHGNSGGPAFNDAGQVIGIATFGTEAAGFNFLVPINTAMEFVRETGVSPDVGSFNPVWASALDLYDEGKCKASISEFDNALQMMPGLPDATQYRNLAAKCWESKNGFQKFMETSAWAVYAAVVLIVLALLAIVLFSRRQTASVAVAVPAGSAAQVRIDVAPTAAALPGQPTKLESYGNIQATAGALAGKTFKITKEGLLIGRSPKCQVVLQDDTISSEHAWIVPTGNEVVVIDKGSSNGTYVNSVDSPRVSKIGLRNGDRIYLGKKGAAVFTYFNS